MDTTIKYFTLKYNGDWQTISKAIEKKQKIKYEDFSSVVNKFKQQNLEFVSIANSRFPRKIKQIKKPPFGLFYRGNLELIKDSSKTILFFWFGNNLERIQKAMKALKNTNAIIIIKDSNIRSLERIIELANKYDLKIVLNLTTINFDRACQIKGVISMLERNEMLIFSDTNNFFRKSFREIIGGVVNTTLVFDDNHDSVSLWRKSEFFKIIDDFSKINIEMYIIPNSKASKNFWKQKSNQYINIFQNFERIKSLNINKKGKKYDRKE